MCFIPLTQSWGKQQTPKLSYIKGRHLEVITMDICVSGPTGGSQTYVALLLSHTLVAYHCFLFQGPPLS